MWQVQALLFPRGELVCGWGLEEFRADRDNAARRTELALGTDRVIRNELGDLVLAACHHNFLACLDAKTRR
jgi:hypothetical protein